MKRAFSAALTAGLLLSSVAGTSVGYAQAGKSIVIGMGQEPDRIYNSTMFVTSLVANLVYDNLLAVDDRMQAYPSLAAQIPTLENGLATFTGEGGDRRLEVTFPLRQGITWSDGTPFTADDVVYFWRLMMNPQSGYDTSLEGKVSDVVKLDDYTVKFVWLSANEAKAKDPQTYANQGTDPVIDPLYFFGLFDNPDGIQPRHKLAEVVAGDPMTSPDVTNLDNSDLARNPVGTGPYVLSSWEPGVALTFTSRGEALPQRQGRPNIDTVVFRIIPAKDTNLAALEAGEVQVVTTDVLDVGDSSTLDAMPGIQAQYVQGTVWEHLTFNYANPFLADRNVRQAIGYGVNRQELVDVLLFGKSQPATSQIPSWSWAFNPDVQRYEYNPGLADQLLRASGWEPGPDGIRVKDGQRLSLKYWSTPSAFRPRLLPLVKDQLAQIGIEMNVELIPASVYFSGKGDSPQSLSARQFDVAEFAWVGGYDPGADSTYSMHSKNIPSKENNYRGGNYGGFRHNYNDVLLNQGTSSLDQEFRRIVYAQVQQIWMSELPVLPLFLRPVTGAATANLVNFRVSMTSSGETWNVEQWDLVG